MALKRKAETQMTTEDEVVVKLGDMCVVCHDAQEKPWVTSCCRQRIHHRCLRRWLNESKSCPVCRGKMPEILNTCMICMDDDLDLPMTRCCDTIVHKKCIRSFTFGFISDGNVRDPLGLWGALSVPAPLDGIPTKHRSLYTIRKHLAKNKARKFRLASLGGQWPYKKQQYIDDYGTKGIKEPSEDFEEEEFVDYFDVNNKNDTDEEDFFAAAEG
ncbi:hypothetical protein ACROYT_G014458 [Oculina patagonica]